MFKRVLVAALLATTIVFAFPAIGGSRGFYRVIDTKSDGYGMLSLSLHNTIQRAEVRDTNWYQLALRGGVTYAPLDWMDFWVSPTYGVWSDDFGFTNSHVGFYDTRFGLKMSVLAIPVFKFGFMGQGNINTLSDEFGYGESGFGYGGGLLLGADFADISVAAPFNLVANVGYLMNSAENTTDSLALGIGLELPAKTYAATIELTTVQDMDNLFDFEYNSMIITPGIKFTFPFGVGLDLGLDIAFGGNAPTFQGILGINFVSPFLRPAPPPVGVVAGSVLDDFTGDPLAARVFFADTSLNIPGIMTDPATGVFQFDTVPTGVVTVVVQADNYREMSIPLVVKENETTTQEFRLIPKKTYGSITGVVKDAKTGAPVQAKIRLKGLDIPPITTDANGFYRLDSVPTGIASVEATAPDFLPSISTVQIEINKTANLDLMLKTTKIEGEFLGQIKDRKTEEPIGGKIIFPESDIPPVVADPATGVFKATLPAGTYAIIVTSEGYIQQPSPLVIKEDDYTEKEFNLVKKGMTFTLHNIHFDFNKSTIKPESYPVLDEAAKILKENPSIRVEIQGHTDSVGSDEYNQTLSEARAASVVNYFVMKHQIDTRRLVAKGYGESKPIASNASEAGRELNRRVEFVILGEM
ncbi:OmpA family protein [candidate division WOR-3 bacterium]|uniref:OmpA family protein n=1 Tax=candidate division WOR-3 bacterium TaxID=2052148 RepID=A0A9D5KBP9_UNCW3|nr:OmpA family protein [candidate division WOR-3 bacterium]MBD3365254.1 OmpA family protein [candidate division WOR-3 bacterium]